MGFEQQLQDIVQQAVMMDIIVFIIKYTFLFFFLRWVLQIKTLIKLLEEISLKMDDLPKKPIEWDDIMPPQRKEEDLATRYGPKF